MGAALNPEQRAAVEHGDGPLMVLAGAGTGKTRVLVHRIARLLESGVAPWEILAVTFTNKAAREMRERLVALVGPVAQRMWIGTFHATCARLLRRWGEAIGLPRDFLIFDDDDQQKVLTALIKEAGFEDQISARTIAARLDWAGNRGLDPITALGGPGGDYAQEFVQVIVPRYHERLAREKAVDFAGLILKVLALCKHAELGPRLAGLYRQVLVDEFQDTNLVQYELVRHLTSITRNLTVVGDDDQSIYAWRGAEPRNLLDFDRDFPDVREIKLEQNYRSTAVILDAANAVIGKNLDRRGKALWTEAGFGDPIDYLACADDRGEAETVARTLRALVDDGACSPGEVCFLYRTNAQSRPLEEQLRRFRFEPKVVGATAFFDRREVKDAIAYLRLLSNADADSAFERVVNVPPRGIGATTVDRLREAARARGLGLLATTREVVHGGGFGAATLGAAARKKLAGFLTIIDSLVGVRDGGGSLSELIIQVVERSGYREYVEHGEGDGPDRMRNLAELVNVASDYEAEVAADPDPGAEQDPSDAPTAVGLAGFLERIALVGAADGADGRGETVTLMTIHMAKGLEFDIVFLCGMEDGLFPSLRAREEVDEAAALEEERRLAYVAITRARRHLYVSSARLRRVWGELKAQMPSRFLDDIPSACFSNPRRVPAIAPPMMMPPRPPPGLPLSARRPARPPADEFDQRSYDDDLPVFRVDDDGGFPPGATVRHQAFGRGRVVEAHGSAPHQRVVVEFPGIDPTVPMTRTIDARWLARE